jgi:hypothetical protein
MATALLLAGAVLLMANAAGSWSAQRRPNPQSVRQEVDQRSASIYRSVLWVVGAAFVVAGGLVALLD